MKIPDLTQKQSIKILGILLLIKVYKWTEGYLLRINVSVTYMTKDANDVIEVWKAWETL